MSRTALSTFNRGLVSRLSLGRTDVNRVALSAELQTNWMPRTLGSMMLRPGLEKIGVLAGKPRVLKFAARTDDTAIVSLTDGAMQVFESGEDLIERPAVGVQLSNGGFASSLAGWTDASDAGASTSWYGASVAALEGSGTATARLRQQVTPVDGSLVHALRIIVDRGPIVLRVGSTAGADDVFRQAVLRAGTHSLAFIPGGAFWVEFSSSSGYPTLLDHCVLEDAGAMELPTPWAEADLENIRHHQVGDVIFVAASGYRQRRIERRPNGSWSVVEYAPEDGPFQIENTDATTITSTALSGEVTLTASAALWQSGHVGALWQITSQGQSVEGSVAGAASFTSSIRVTGVGTSRTFAFTLSGTWSGTVSLQRSIGGEGDWVTVQTYTTNTSASYNDDLDNSIVFYRFGFEGGNYTSGTADVTINYPSGSITGVARIYQFVSDTEVRAYVLKDLGGTEATPIWREGSWSDVAGWPEAVALWQGRLWWSGVGRIYGSVSDAFASFNPDAEGDAAPINRLVGDGTSNRTNFLLPLQRLIVGSDEGEYEVTSGSLDEPVTPSTFNIRAVSTKGSTQVEAVWADRLGFMAGRDNRNIYELAFGQGQFQFETQRATILVPEIAEAGIRRLSTQQSPDMRLHVVLSDGASAVLVRDPAEDVTCWVRMETDGTIMDAVSLPSEDEDQMYYVVERLGVYYLTRWATERQARGGLDNRIADLFVAKTEETATTTLTGLDHINQETVVVWADGVDLGEHRVSGGAVTLDEPVTQWCAGLPYTAPYRSSKLAVMMKTGPDLTERKKIEKLGLVLADAHPRGLRYGPSFDVLDDMPLVENGLEVDADTVWDAYDEPPIEFPGEIDSDTRLCLEARAPRPVTVLAAVLTIDRRAG